MTGLARMQGIIIFAPLRLCEKKCLLNPTSDSRKGAKASKITCNSREAVRSIMGFADPKIAQRDTGLPSTGARQSK
jgi:hypothetical protein